MTGPQGEQGVQGERGPIGPTGYTPIISATASIDNTTGTPEVTVNKTGTDDNPILTFVFEHLKGVQGEQGIQGETGADGEDGKGILSINFDRMDSSGNNIYRVTMTDGTVSYFTANRGPQGPQGIPGTGEDGVGISSITFDEDVVGGKQYLVTLSNGQTYTFIAPQGPAGEDGDDGANGVTPTITADATVSNTVGTPSCSVSKTGTDENPAFHFAFSNIKGETGATGAAGADGADGADGLGFPTTGPAGDLFVGDGNGGGNWKNTVALLPFGYPGVGKHAEANPTSWQTGAGLTISGEMQFNPNPDYSIGIKQVEFRLRGPNHLYTRVNGTNVTIEDIYNYIQKYNTFFIPYVGSSEGVAELNYAQTDVIPIYSYESGMTNVKLGMATIRYYAWEINGQDIGFKMHIDAVVFDGDNVYTVDFKAPSGSGVEIYHGRYYVIPVNGKLLNDN